MRERPEMTIRRTACRYALLILGVALSLPLRASANTESCTQAHAAGQREENAGHLKEALTHFQECASDAACPLPIRNECTSLYSTVEGRLPTLVFSVVDSNGNDVTDVRVTSGEAQIADGLYGRPTAIDPGRHELRFELPDGQSVTKSVVVRQGEKDRIVAIKLPRSEFTAAASAEAPAATADTSTNIAPDSEKKRFTVPVASYVAYGGGVAALATWGTFGLLGRHKDKQLVDCSPNCPSSRHADYDTMKRDYLIADIMLGVGAAAIVAGTVTLFTMGRRSSSDDRAAKSGSARALSFSPLTVGHTGGGLMLRGKY